MATAAIHEVGTKDGWHGVIEKGGKFEPETDRYHLYIGHFCPFAQRANIVRHLKGLEEVLPVSVVRPYPRTWKFDPEDEYPGATKDHLFNFKEFSDIYFKDDGDYKGVYSVPVVWDKKTNALVNSESAEMLRWLPKAFESIVPDKSNGLDLYPEQLRSKIDLISPVMNRDVNMAVYKAGFAKDQESYSANVPPLFGALNFFESFIHKNGGPYVLGKQMTELDVRLYVTAIRFDVVYVQHFKVDLGTIRHNYPVINNWLKNIYWNHEAFKDTTDFTHIKENYTKSQEAINPLKITPLGPFPFIEEGYEADWSKLTPGGVAYGPAVEHQKKLEQELAELSKL